jgi:multiple sugar transport system substrate-binding protein
MNAKTRNKEAAWLFIQWATSKEVLLQSALAGNLDPVRRSVWEHPDVVAMTSKWDNGNWRKVVTDMLEKYAAWYPTPQTELVAVWDRWIQAYHEIYAGKDAQQAMDEAARDIEQILIRAGLKR